jgi:hypothetical protein
MTVGLADRPASTCLHNGTAVPCGQGHSHYCRRCFFRLQLTETGPCGRGRGVGPPHTLSLMGWAHACPLAGQLDAWGTSGGVMDGSDCTRVAIGQPACACY